MQLHKYLFLTLFLITPFASLSADPVKPGTPIPALLKMEMIDQAIESIQITQEYGLSGKVSKLVPEVCSTCEPVTIKVGGKTRFYIDTNIIPDAEIHKWNQKPGTIIFDPDTLVAKSVRYFNMEG